jgi:hypothetical protein
MAVFAVPANRYVTEGQPIGGAQDEVAHKSYRDICPERFSIRKVVLTALALVNTPPCEIGQRRPIAART